MDIVASKLVQGVATAAESGSASPVAPSERAVARFEEIMQAEPAAFAGSTAVGPVPLQSYAAAPANGPSSLGDRILVGLNGMSADFQQTWRGVTKAVDAGATTSMADLLKLQMSLTQLSIQYELVNKAVSRSTQNIDQLIKLQ